MLAETGHIAIINTFCMSWSMTGFNWATFFGTPLMPSMCSDVDLPEFSAVFSWH